MVVETIIKPYKEIFGKRDSKNLESLEKRFAWFSWALIDFK